MYITNNISFYRTTQSFITG